MNTSLRDRAEHAAKYGANLVVTATEIKQLFTDRDQALERIDHLREQIGVEVRDRLQWEANAEQAESALERVRALHTTDAEGHCTHCTRGRVYPVPAPCATAASLAGGGDER